MHQVDDIPIETFFRPAGEGHEHATRGAIIIEPEEDGETRSRTITLVSTVRPNALDVRRNFFSNRVVAPWNSLPNSVKFAQSVNSFKNLYDDHMK